MAAAHLSRRGLSLWLICITLISGFYWKSSLSFFPVPWPDDSAFSLVGTEWIHSPSQYRMHSQAPFVPSYDQANFNTMPGLPLLMGIGQHLGFGDAQGVRIWGILAFSLWIGLLLHWMKRKKFSPFWIGVTALMIALSPTLRWGTVIGRTEAWVGLCWTFLLLEFDFFYQKPFRWRMPAFLALSAYFHFEAIVWVLPVAIGLYPFSLEYPPRERYRIWLMDLWAITWRTLVCLSPWLLYVLTHFSTFIEQMQVQFSRFSHIQPYSSLFDSIKHGPFQTLGNPVPYPKFFNVIRAIYWTFFLFVSVRAGALIFRSTARKHLVGAAFAAWIACWFLWVQKSEAWFSTLIHFSFWPLFILSISGDSVGMSRLRKALAIPAIALAGLQVGLAIHLWEESRHVFKWSAYREWAKCINEKIGPLQKVWQPTSLDVLVELSALNSSREYTRHVDFPGRENLVRDHAMNSQAILHTLYFAHDQKESKESHQGEARPSDIELLKNYPWLAYREWSAVFLNNPQPPTEPAPSTEGPSTPAPTAAPTPSSSSWSLQICHQGPFWAAISTH